MNYELVNRTNETRGPGARVGLVVKSDGSEFSFESFYDLDKALKDKTVEGLSIYGEGADPFDIRNDGLCGVICSMMRNLHPEKSIWVWTKKLFEDIKVSPLVGNIDVLIDRGFEGEGDNLRCIDVRESLKVGHAVKYERL